MSKYIIKNCPALYQIKGMTNECLGTDYQCQDCTDCVLKQIYEKCKNVQCPCEYKGADCRECTESGAKRFADKILQLLDIQEGE